MDQRERVAAGGDVGPSLGDHGVGAGVQQTVQPGGYRGVALRPRNPRAEGELALDVAEPRLALELAGRQPVAAAGEQGEEREDGPHRVQVTGEWSTGNGQQSTGEDARTRQTDGRTR